MQDSSAEQIVSNFPPPKLSWWIPSVFGVTIGVILLITTFLIPIKADDIWWHLKAGEYIFTHLSLPDQNMFSFTAPDHSWLPHEWLSELVFYVIYKTLGHQGLIAFGILLNAIVCGLVYKLCNHYSRSPYLSSIITLLATLMILGNFSLRPYLFGNLFFILTMYAMEEPETGGRLRPILIFLIFTAWANFHGSFLIGLALILIFMFASLILSLSDKKRNFVEARRFFTDFIIATVACVVTPNHVYGLIFPLVYVQQALSPEVSYLTNLSEWQPAGFNTPLGRMITFYLGFTGFALVGSGRRLKPSHFGLLVAFATFAYSSIRNIPLLGIVTTPILARHLPASLGRTWKLMAKQTTFRGLFDRLHAKSVEINRRSRTIILPVVWTIVLAIVFTLPASSPVSYRSLSGVGQLNDLSPHFYPKDILAELKHESSNRRIFNYFNWGGAFIWALYPQHRVFIDQRNDCYPIEVFTDYFAIHKVAKDWLEILDGWEIDLVAYPPDTSLAEALWQSPYWELDYVDDQAVLFRRIFDIIQPTTSDTASPGTPERQ
jgi:hypothetical protein